MASNFSLDGSIVPRTVRRRIDQRTEPRADAATETAVVELRGRKHEVELVNLSHSGAMAIFSLIPHIGETISVALAGRPAVDGYVCWVRGGKIGITFASPVE
jgi:hypothetical protein